MQPSVLRCFHGALRRLRMGRHAETVDGNSKLASVNTALPIGSSGLGGNQIIMKSLVTGGSVRDTTEIIQKENQGCTKIFLCPIFKTKKNKYFLGVTVFNLTKLHAKKDIIPLGGINDKNIKIINLCRVKSVAGISWIKKNGPSINTGPFKF